MIKRKMYDVLKEWRKNKNENGSKKALLILGARQVGKTYIVEEFGKNEYESFIKINFIKQKELKAIFEGNLDAESIYSRLTLYIPGAKLIPGKTLIFLDEIQSCGNARTAIKFLAEDNRFDIIESGSLLGLEYGEEADKEVEVPDSYPVGFEKKVYMYSLDFEEYLWANGYLEEQIAELKRYFDQNTPVPEVIHNKYLRLFREYMVIGGMPEVVQTFITNRNFNDAFDVQDTIISSYQDDISKHAKGAEKIKVRQCYDAIPRQLSKELTKFQYSFVEKGKTRRHFGGSVKWLIDSNLVHPCYNVYEPLMPLMANENIDQFKLYLNDTGLLLRMYGRATQIAVLKNTIRGNAKGGIYESIISECLIKRGYDLHFYKPDDNHEIEFVIEKVDGVVPVEVKAGNTATVSLDNFIKDFTPPIAYKIGSANVGVVEKKKTIPHYMVIFL